jgi:hypothetical protein
MTVLVFFLAEADQTGYVNAEYYQQDSKYAEYVPVKPGKPMHEIADEADKNPEDGIANHQS